MKIRSHRAAYLALIWLASAGMLQAQQIAETPALPPGTLGVQSAAGNSNPPVAEDAHPSVPAYSSQPGAPYTIYLDFGGFNFNGNWGNSPSYTPGAQAAYDGAGASFGAVDLANIEKIWTGIATIYAPYHVNVTTVDPAVAAGQAGSDTTRQNYYDSQPGLMHTVIGGNDSWVPGGAGGISYVGVTPYAETGSNGLHTNFLFANEAPGLISFITTGASHENGHGFGLVHQSNYNGTTLVNEYSQGTGTGPGSVAPIMGVAYYSERGLWAIGTADQGVVGIQNDAKTIVNDPNMNGFVNDGIGHALGAATPLPMNGGAINFNLSQGVIVPSDATNPSTTSYTSDFWSFHTSGGDVTITANSGRESITPGTPDPGGTLGALLEILRPNGTVVAVSGTSTLSETLTVHGLAAGTYIAEVLSAGQIVDNSYSGRDFYNMGPYFLTGTIPQAVPEPSMWALSLCGLVGLAELSIRRRRARLRSA